MKDDPALPLGGSPGGSWMPIESAPKDGTNILLSNGVSVSEGQWLHQDEHIREHRDLDGRYIDQDEFEGFDGWVDWGGGMMPGPTHWMPLPPPSSPLAPGPNEMNSLTSQSEQPTTRSQP